MKFSKRELKQQFSKDVKALMQLYLNKGLQMYELEWELEAIQPEE